MLKNKCDMCGQKLDNYKDLRKIIFLNPYIDTKELIVCEDCDLEISHFIDRIKLDNFGTAGLSW